MNEPHSYIVAAVLFDFYAKEVPNFRGVQKPDQIPLMLMAVYGAKPPQPLVDEAIESLIASKAIVVISDPFTSDYYAFDERACNRLFMTRADSKDDNPYSKAKQFGANWLSEALENVSKRAANDTTKVLASIPASDRVVGLDHNRADYRTIQKSLADVVDTINTSNEVSAALGDDKDRITSELKAGQELVRADKVRVSALLYVLIKPLKYIADKFSGAALGEAAKQLVILIVKLLSS